jgi:aspartate racemase
MTEKIIGVLGGMGPAATVDIFQKILAANPCQTDQEQLRIVIDCNSKIPDRTGHILHHGLDPVPYLVESARKLEEFGAGLIVIPCNAAHYFHAKVQEAVNIPVFHIMKATYDYMSEKYSSSQKVGLLAATSTVQVGLYQEVFEKKGKKVVIPDHEFQEDVMTVIFDHVKKGDTGNEARKLIRNAGLHLVTKGSEVVLAGCTEIPLVLRDGDLPVPVVDPTEALAVMAVRYALE